MTLASVGDGVIATDTHGRVTFLNPVAVDLTGWPQEETQGRLLEEVFRIVHEDTRQPVENPVNKVLAENKVVGLANHTLLVARDCTARPIEDSAAPIWDEAGILSGVVLVFRDGSEQRRAEALLAGQKRVLELMVQGAPLNGVLETLCATVEGQADEPLTATVYLVVG